MDPAFSAGVFNGLALGKEHACQSAWVTATFVHREAYSIFRRSSASSSEYIEMSSCCLHVLTHVQDIPDGA